MCALAAASAGQAWAGPAAPADYTPAASADTRLASRWIGDSADNAGLPYAIVDKRAAVISVYDRSGRRIGSSRVLLGLGAGDTSIPDIAQRDVTRLKPAERITPAGRFVSQPGHNQHGEDIVWVDYGAAIAIHRLRPAPAREHRPERLASEAPSDKRISAGCIVVPVAFYEQVVRPTLGGGRGVVYVLPESRPVASMFDALQARNAVPATHLVHCAPLQRPRRAGGSA
ncbi:MAG: hypothetical protein JSR59_06985 [Proteobacteria bacterium]|nr:hypothetical protein [Pseudomonadota bacterium]